MLQNQYTDKGFDPNIGAYGTMSNAPTLNNHRVYET